RYVAPQNSVINHVAVVNNGRYGLQLGSVTTKIYNNTILTDNTVGGIWVYDDQRNKDRPLGVSVGPDTTEVEVVNNVVYNLGDSLSALNAQGTEYSGTNTMPEQFFNAVDYNAYYRGEGVDKPLIRWIKPGDEKRYYSTSE